MVTLHTHGLYAAAAELLDGGVSLVAHTGHERREVLGSSLTLARRNHAKEHDAVTRHVLAQPAANPHTFTRHVPVEFEEETMDVCEELERKDEKLVGKDEYRDRSSWTEMGSGADTA